MSDLKAGLFERNKDFLSNPLLSAMMLLTYDSYGEIPERRHIFYAKCFDVLAREHDASKGRYKRELFSRLAIDQLEVVFMFFCTMSYVERRLSLSREQMTTFVTNAIAACVASAKVDAVVRDFTESISIMELVGLNYEFAHRSFQEYFYAKFVVSDRELTLEDKVGWLCNKFDSDDTVEMIADMDRTYFEDEFLLPLTRKLDTKLAKLDPNVKPASVLSKFFSVVHVGGHGSETERDDRLAVSYTFSDGKEPFIWWQALGTYRDVAWVKSKESPAERKRQVAKHVNILRDDYGGELKIHHRNNDKLRRIGASQQALRIGESISRLRRHLEEKQERRRRGLGMLLRKKYLAG